MSVCVSFVQVLYSISAHAHKHNKNNMFKYENLKWVLSGNSLEYYKCDTMGGIPSLALSTHP